MPAGGVALLAPGDVIFGKLRPYLAKSLLVTEPVYASTEFLGIRPSSRLDSRMLAYLVQSRHFVDWTVATSEGTKMPRTSWEKVGAFCVPDVAPGRQRAVADFLDVETARIDALIAKKRSMIGLIEERRWASFMASVETARVPRVPLRRALLFITDGPFGSAFTSDEYTDDGIAVVRLGNIGFAEFSGGDLAHLADDRLGEFARYQVHNGDVLFAGLGDERNHAGRACVAPDLGDAIVKGKCFCARIDLERADPDFVALYFSSPAGAEAIAAETRGSTRSMINLEIVKSVDLPLPSVHEQRAIARHTRHEWKAVHRLRRVLHDQIALLQEHRQALITAAVTGELEVPGVAA
jgi:type I restriction enzyme S subunit